MNNAPVNQRLSDLYNLERTLRQIQPRMLVAPPRTASTALARALSYHSRIGPGYVHEPCGVFLHKGEPIQTINTAIIQANRHRGRLPNRPLIKEVSFQLGAGDVFSIFVHSTAETIIVLIRDPILTVESRLRMVCADMIAAQHPDNLILNSAIASCDYRQLNDIIDDRIFPTAFTGWECLDRQLELSRPISVFVLYC
jgi:hypothetical protein